jgi:hypothetical protein
MPTDTTSLVIVAISWSVALLLAVALWRKPGSTSARFFWTVLLAFPVVGPVAFVILHDPPSPRAGCGSCGPASCSEDEQLTRLGRGEPTGHDGDHAAG